MKPRVSTIAAAHILLAGVLSCHPSSNAAPEHGSLQPGDLAGASVDSLVAALAVTDGHLHDSAVVIGNMSGAARLVADELIDRGEVALPALLDCMDSVRPSLVKQGTEFVKTGYVCYVVLTSMVYHEEFDELGDVTGGWPGYITADASAVDMRNAQAAWREVVRSRSFVRLF
jgi:hypothetical protein